MTDRLNYGVVEDKLSSFNSSCDSLYNAIKEMDDAVSSSVNSLSGAIYGRLGKQLMRDWENNCAMFTNFKGMFEEWHSLAVDICVRNEAFERDNSGIETTYEGTPSGDVTGGTV